MHIKGEFEVKMVPVPPTFDSSDQTVFGRMTIDKTYHGALSAISKGEMLSAMTTTKGSAGYVAIEQLQGSLDGRTGSFVLQHYGIMDQGKDRLILEVVPDSGSEGFNNLSGSMTIIRENGKHFYEFTYKF